MSLKLNRRSINDTAPWNMVGISLPQFSIKDMIRNTSRNPVWVHFGAGNIFRGFIAAAQQTLMEMGMAKAGIIAVESYDSEIMDRIYLPHDNLSLLVLMHTDGRMEKKIIGSISEGLVATPLRKENWERLKNIFYRPSLQMVSFTVTEKGYFLKEPSGNYIRQVLQDIENGPEHPAHVMSQAASLVYSRYLSGELPIALISMDNCSRNGELLNKAVMDIAEKWRVKGFVDKGFINYLNNPLKVSFPWTMIDKITPRPSEKVKNNLQSIGVEDVEIICTDNHTHIAPFVNAEIPEYLVIEDDFPNGRMPLELAGVYFTDRETVEKMERMKAGACLNPLHTALAIFGCLLGYTLVADEMKDENLKRLVEKLGYTEGLPVVEDPEIIDPREFLKEVIETRLPNKLVPDSPQRIAVDTSHKMPIRFGETIKSYCLSPELDVSELFYIPLVIAGWCRYLLGFDDNGNTMEVSPDPIMDELKDYLCGIKLGVPGSTGVKLRPILGNPKLFGVNLYDIGLGQKTEALFREMLAGKDAVRNVLAKYLG